MKNNGVKQLIYNINQKVNQDLRLMEVCGTHTQAIAKAGLSNILSPSIKLISGPGCPVCVTGEGYIDAAIELLRQKDTIIVSFGDMIRVRGSSKSLEDCMELKDRIKIVYTPFTVLDIAEQYRDKEVIFLAVGFETTAPVIAALVKLAKKRGIVNMSLLAGLKLMPPILEVVLSMEGSSLDGLICPGHVSAVMGADYFSFIPERYGIPAVISGFEQTDVAAAVHWLIHSITACEKSRLFNIYGRCVKDKGNAIAKELIQEVFWKRDGYWRGIGQVIASELSLREEYSNMDAENRFAIAIEHKELSASCQCSEIIVGSKSPIECRMFGLVCTPKDPKGPCMISSEGSCSIYYRYKRSCV